MEETGIRRTKIVATVGPASWDPPTLVEMIEAGVDVFRLNFSHADEARHRQTVKDIRAASETTGREVGILGDLPGPKLRVGHFPHEVVEIVTGSDVTLTPAEIDGSATEIPVPWPEMADVLKEGAIVYLADGTIRLEVTARSGDSLIAHVHIGGPLSSNKGMNLPGARIRPRGGLGIDLAWVDFSVANQIDLLAVSFVRGSLRSGPGQEAAGRARHSDIPVIAKIEKPEAAEAIEAIVEAAGGGIMVARGDLGIEVPLSKVPVLQKHLIREAGQWSRPVITATQMLASMVHEKRPTRAEVTDVATAIFDGTDAVMLSEETAVGAHPVETIRVMDQIARATEPDLPYWDWLFNRASQDDMEVSDSVTQSAVIACYRLGLETIVVPTASGRGAIIVAAHRPRVPVLAVTHSLQDVAPPEVGVRGRSGAPRPDHRDPRPAL